MPAKKHSPIYAEQPDPMVADNSWQETRDAVERTMRRINPSGFREDYPDHVANHIVSGSSEGSPFAEENKHLADPAFWHAVAAAGDPTVDISEDQAGLRSGFKDLETWSGPHWNEGDIKRYQGEALFGELLGRRPGAYELSPGAQEADVWKKDREVLQRMAGGRTFDAGQVFKDTIQDNGNPLGYINNNWVGPWSKAAYDTAMEYPVTSFRDPDPSLPHYLDPGGMRMANWMARPVAGFLSNLRSFPGHLATATDVYQNGSAAFRQSPDIQLGSKGMDAQKELQGIRGDIEAAQGTMPHKLYHHRNTGEFPSMAGNMGASMGADMVTDPSIAMTALLAPLRAARGVKAMTAAGVPQSTARAAFKGSTARAVASEAGEELAWGGIPNAMSAFLSPEQGMTHEEARTAENQWWPDQQKNHLKAEARIRDNHMRNGFLKGTLLSP
jgi:hypothetical protein